MRMKDKIALITGAGGPMGRAIARRLAEEGASLVLTDISANRLDEAVTLTHEALAEGADIAVFAGDRKGIIYVQGQRVANIPEEEILDRLLAECRKFQDRVRSGEAKLGEKTVEIVPPEVSGEAGAEHVTIGKS